MEEYRQITLDEWTQWKEDIRRKLAETAGNFVYIGYRLKQIRDSGMYGGAADIFGFAQKEYGLGKSTVSRFIAINEKYSEGGNSLELKEEFRGFSSSKLAEMLTLPDSEIGLITEKTTIREIRELKAFNSQEQKESEETAGEAAGVTGQAERTPLEKCLTDFFKDKKDMLNGIMKHLETDPPGYREAAELMAPSQTSHQKGIVFLFLYDWNTGIKYKSMTEPEPVAMGWPELLNTVYGIYGAGEQEDVWGAFYAAEEEAEKAVLTGSNQGSEPVATSQQNGEKGPDGPQGEIPGDKGKKAGNQEEEQEAAGVGNEEGGENTPQNETCADSKPDQEHTDDIKPADNEAGAAGSAGEDSAGGGEDRESGAGGQDAGVNAEPGEEGGTEADQIKGQASITDYPEYMADAAEAAGVEESDIEDATGMGEFIETQTKIIIEELQTMRVRCIQHNWDGLIERAQKIIARAENIRNMEDMWNE